MTSLVAIATVKAQSKSVVVYEDLRQHVNSIRLNYAEISSIIDRK